MLGSPSSYLVDGARQTPVSHNVTGLDGYHYSHASRAVPSHSCMCNLWSAARQQPATDDDSGERVPDRRSSLAERVISPKSRAARELQTAAPTLTATPVTCSL
jgi:hypothetical protein